jgi:hypothetical protein
LADAIIRHYIGPVNSAQAKQKRGDYTCSVFSRRAVIENGGLFTRHRFKHVPDPVFTGLNHFYVMVSPREIVVIDKLAYAFSFACHFCVGNRDVYIIDPVLVLKSIGLSFGLKIALNSISAVTPYSFRKPFVISVRHFGSSIL